MNKLRLHYYSFIMILVLTSILNIDTASAGNKVKKEPNYSSAIYSANIEEDYEETIIKDDLEQFNRVVFSVNKGVDNVVFKPVAKTYQYVTPLFLRDRASDFLHNLSEPVHFINFVLQGKPNKAGDVFGRFLVNSILGVGGIFDISQEAGNKKVYADFGLTLGHWGLETGQYLVLPILGPSSFRDFPGTAADILMDPLTWTTTSYFSAARAGGQFIVNREAVLDFTDDLEQTTLDEYSSIRSIYFQKREVKK